MMGIQKVRTGFFAGIALAVALGAAVLLVSPVTGSAPLAQEYSESHLDAARRAINATRSTNRLDSILPALAQNAKTELIRDLPDKELEINVIVDEAAISLAARRGDLENEAVQIFARVFTEAELNTIADFYESEAGQKFLNDTPVVLREIEQASRVWRNGVQRDMNRAIIEAMQAQGLR